MADLADIANDRAQVQLDDLLATRQVFSGFSALVCEDCGIEIPPARRVAVQGCTHCFDCQSLNERTGGRRHG